MKELTIKEEKAVQAYMVDGNKTDAYKSSYTTENMKPATINRKAHLLFKKENVRARIEVLRKELEERNKITVDEIVQELAGIIKFDVKTMYDDRGELLPINKMPTQARKMIARMETTGKQINKVSLVSKMDAAEKLMRHLGGYEKDKPIIPVADQTTVNIYQLPDNGRN